MRGRELTSPPAAAAVRTTALFVVLALATLAAYSPALHGGMLWDDDAHLTPPALASCAGLWRIWTDFTASQQYYPVVGTAFWLLNKLWGHHPLGYHVVNILLHALSATLLWLLLRRWSVHGALLAAVLFALHPVHVESVAWMSELKNTLSGALYLLAVMAYLGFDATRERRRYVLAMLLFALALGSKTVTATMPAAMLVVIWWRRGRIDWRRDLLPLLPFFALGAAAGLGTAWIEYAWVGAQGDEFSLTWPQRLLLAGRAVWFYAAKLLWPSRLVFSYPRWSIDASVWWQWLFPLAAVVTIVAAWRLRRRSRAPLALALCFVVTLLPALGFFDIYLASIGVLVAIAATLMRLVERLPWRVPEIVLAGLVAVPLFVVTLQQSRQYVDAETLYRTTIAANPQSMLAHDNLAALLLAGPESGWQEAATHAEAAVEFGPNDAEAHNNLGLAWQRLGRAAQAEREHRRAIELEPRLAAAHYNLALALAAQEKSSAAVAEFEQSLRLAPDQPLARRDFATTLERLGRTDDAIAQLRVAVRLQPDSPDLRLELGNMLQTKRAFAEAIAAYHEALRLHPDWGEALHNLAIALSRAGKPQESLTAFAAAEHALPQSVPLRMHFAAQLAALDRLDDAVVQLQGGLAEASAPQAAELDNEIGSLRLRQGRTADAIASFEAALRLRPEFREAKANLETARGR